MYGGIRDFETRISLIFTNSFRIIAPICHFDGGEIKTITQMRENKKAVPRLSKNGFSFIIYNSQLIII